MRVADTIEVRQVNVGVSVNVNIKVRLRLTVIVTATVKKIMMTIAIVIVLGFKISPPYSEFVLRHRQTNVVQVAKTSIQVMFFYCTLLL